MRDYSAQFTIRIKPEDRDLLVAYAKQLNTTPGAFMRELALKAAREGLTDNASV